MRRISPVLVSAVACVAFFAAGSAVAKTPVKTCTTSSKNVVGHTVTGKLTASNVNTVQAEFATCGHAKKVMNRVTALRVEEPKSVAAFYCLPTVVAVDPDAVKYVCTFKGADTPMYVKLTFSVEYDQD